MAATMIGRSLLTYRSSSSYLMSKRLLSSIARAPPLPGFSRSTVSLSHSLRVVVPRAGRLNLIQCSVNRSGGAYSPLNSGSNFSDRPPTETAPLFPECDYEHLVDRLGSEEEAKKKIYDVSCERYFGFGCEIDEETSNKLEGLPGVLFVLPDSYVGAENKDYGAMAMAMAAKIARSLALRSQSSMPTPGFPRPYVASLSNSLGAVNLDRSAGSYSMINFNSIFSPPLFRGLDGQVRFFNGISIQKMKFPKYRKGRISGVRDGGNNICFGKYALQALEPARITSKQIEAGRRALQMNVRRGGKGGKVWVRVFPYKSVTSKPSETRMGRGKGSISYWVAPVKAGQILYEMGGVTESLAKKAIQIAGSKMPIQTRSIIRDPKTKEIGIR